MTPQDFIALGPLLAVALGAIAALLSIGVRRRPRAAFAICGLGLAAGLAAIVPAWRVAPRAVTGLLVVDGYALFFTGLVLAAAMAVLVLSAGYLRGRGEHAEEYCVLLMLATLGACVLTASTHFASFFLGLELLSVPLYALMAYGRTQRPNIEAALKYLILAGVSSAMLLMGMALVYADLGSLSFAHIFADVAQSTEPMPWFLAGAALILTAVAFKLALAPLHFWAPDVYQGAPAPVTAYVATVSKGAVLALALRYFGPLLAAGEPARVPLAFLAVASMFVGNLIALRQENVKRLLAYSSIAHMGYLLVALLAAPNAVTAVAFYLAAYFATMLIALGVLVVLSRPGAEAQTLDDVRGLAWRRPWLAAAMTAALLSLAGMPLTAGFFGKFYVLLAGSGAGLWGLVIVMVINSALGLYYYLRVVAALFASAEQPVPAAAPLVPLPWAGAVVLAALVGVLVWLGTYPAPLIQMIRLLTAGAN
ncbi:MAG: NADH-quinone oxidoreductase subunit N [Phycisphaerae bacterium]|jgi:NADH-quinone oxidoreductase subunit N